MRPASRTARRHTGRVVGLLALIAIVLAVIQLERGRAGLDTATISIGTTPATIYRQPDAKGPLVVVAHGFAGSRQLMQAYSLTLAQSGYVVVAFDFEGHGRNPVPMSGDVSSVDGTTRHLVEETRRVIAAARELADDRQNVALLGHSMATDVIVRAARAEAEDGTPIQAVVAISMYSEAVSAEEPPRLLIVTGAWEGALRDSALRALRQVRPDAGEGDSATADGVVRRAVVAPGVGHVGVLYSATALREARAWLDSAFEHESDGPLVRPGPWILLLLGGIVALFRPLSRQLPAIRVESLPITTRRFLAAVLLPALVVPLLATWLYRPVLPVLVADYLMIHLAAYGAAQLLLLRAWRQRRALSLPAILLLAFWGIAVFGLAMDRYGASFVPNAERLPIIVVVAVGTIPFMVADACLTGSGRGLLWRRVAARAALFLSLGGAAVLDPERLVFLFIVLPVLLLFFLVHGLMGRWTAQRCGPLSAGIGLGLCLAWALGVSFPLFASG